MSELTYQTKAGGKISGTLEQIISICKKLGEIVEIGKLEGFDETKFYYSTSKDQWLEIPKMATQHIMNAIIKDVRNYYGWRSQLLKIL